MVLSVLTVPILLGAFTDRIGLNDKRTGMFMISGSLVLIYLFGELMLDWNFPFCLRPFLTLWQRA